MKPALTPRALARNTAKQNPMPRYVAAVMAHYRRTGRATPNADAAKGKETP